MSDRTSLEIAIVGAGIAGLSAADRLVEQGHRVRLFDKGRAPGGRASSRKYSSYSVDHGAQYFTARAPEFRSFVDQAVTEGRVARWNGKIQSLGGERFEARASSVERFVGCPQMRALTADWAAKHDVQSSVRVANCSWAEARWQLEDDEGSSLGSFDRLLITAPPAQAAALVGEETSLGQTALSVTMRPCWAVWLVLSRPYGVAFDGAFVANSDLSWIAKDSSKPGRGRDEVWVLHASPTWSAQHLEESRAVVAQRLTAEFERLIGRRLPEVVEHGVHLWRYSIADPALDRTHLFDAERGLALAGDWLHGSRVEGAFLSGLAAARRLSGTAVGVSGTG